MTNLAPAYSPLRLESRPLLWKVGAVLFGSLVLAGASQVSVPLYPVPITLQTFAVAMVGALYGWRLGALTVVVWLLQAAAGLPFLAEAKGGLAPFFGPTAGYLFAFPLLAGLAGWMAARGWNGSRPLLAFVGLVGAHLVHLAIGTAWLASWLGGDLPKAFALGFAPFLIGLAVKSALGAATLKGADSLGARL
ncbi:biotin transporter BioY [Neomegalonema sp.]|uniref:biotin transporter BioY n=1 Tax=Neomegalonema sp. TaxID=2039713 RepID=UPI0026301221|nr:biotin transporter BioY [Neomegalonema sp.]MDD2867565.1 biotin transporter BioY [Neomegalonema sp.]